MALLLRAFGCRDYLDSFWSKRAWQRRAQACAVTVAIYPEPDSFVIERFEFLVVGRLEERGEWLGYRLALPGVWTLNEQTGALHRISDTLSEAMDHLDGIDSPGTLNAD